MSNKIHPGTRPGTRRAKALLAEVAADHKVDVKSLQYKANHRHFGAARREYCILGLQRGIGLGALASALCRDRTTIAYHQKPELRRRKNAQASLWWKRQREIKSRERAVSRETVQQL